MHKQVHLILLNNTVIMDVYKQYGTLASLPNELHFCEMFKLTLSLMLEESLQLGVDRANVSKCWCSVISGVLIFFIKPYKPAYAYVHRPFGNYSNRVLHKCPPCVIR